MIFERGQRIVFIGDSITEAGRCVPDSPFGTGYMNLVRSFVTARYPELGLEWENRGVGGDTSRDMAARWERDAIDLRPDWLSIKIGINDVGRKYRGRPHDAVPIDEYEATLRTLAQRAVEVTGCRLIIAEPYVIEADLSEPRHAETRTFAAVARKVASDLGAISIHTQEAIDRALQSMPGESWSHDRIHPNLPGHAVIALEYLRAIGFDL